MKQLVIVGGGFSGAITAVNLARFCSGPLRITVVNKDNPPCRGIAYSARHDCLLLNVVARNMSALADQPNHFVDWLRTRSDFLHQPLAELRDTFIPRRIYGDYLHALFHWTAQEAAGRGITLEWRDADATQLDLSSMPMRLQTGGGEIEADKVVLAVGNLTPHLLRLPGLSAHHPRCINNPWADWTQKLPDRSQNVLLFGSGLTMIDAFLTLRDMGWTGKIFVLARHAWLPLSHFKGVEHPDLLNDGSVHINLRDMMRLWRRHYRDARARGVNPAILVDKLRPFTQRVWGNFSLAEKRRFLRHLKSRWNFTRHRIAQSVHQGLTAAISAGQVEAIHGRWVGCSETPEALHVQIEENGATREVTIGAVVNCTGPRENYVGGGSPLLDDLERQGRVAADALNMGIRIAPDFAVLDNKGCPAPHLYALGGALKGTLWETTAVPELRSQAFRIAQTLAAQLEPEKKALPKVAEHQEVVMEYWI